MTEQRGEDTKAEGFSSTLSSKEATHMGLLLNYPQKLPDFHRLSEASK
jgi:hypothetical protein